MRTKIKGILTILMLLMVSQAVFGQHFKFRNRQGKAVPCRIKVFSSGTIITEIDTDDKGLVDLTQHCKENVYFVFSPHSPLYTGQQIRCKGGQHAVEVLRISELANLEENSNLDISISPRYTALAAFSTNELATRGRNYGNDLYADSLEARTYQLVASYFGLSEIEAIYQDPLQNNKLVPNQRMVQVIREFQKENGLPATGLIGWKTIGEMAEIQPAVLYTNTEWQTELKAPVMKVDYN
jgi:hypothetical protein